VDESTRRVSDAERERAVELLRDDLLAGRLTLEEFSERVEGAYRARVGAELELSRKDLPDTVPQAVRSLRKPSRLTAAVFGRVVRRGRLRLRRRSRVWCVFGDVDLDLREAVVDDAHATVAVTVLFGNVDVYVPEGVDVDVGGVLAFGRRREWGRDVVRAGAPAIRVRARGLFGTVDVWRVPPGVRGSYSEIFRQLRERQQQLPG
jgi:hypothetical protein